MEVLAKRKQQIHSVASVPQWIVKPQLALTALLDSCLNKFAIHGLLHCNRIYHFTLKDLKSAVNLAAAAASQLTISPVQALVFSLK